jgi:hypothetical protein
MVVQQISWMNLKTKTEFAVATWTAGKLFFGFLQYSFEEMLMV